jgi:molybdopterin molybdotransferase
MSNAPSPALLSYEEAAALVGEYAARLSGRSRPTERVELSCASGRVLARALCADLDQPPFARSTRDGFACRAAEATKHRFLNLVGFSRAGEAPAGPLPEGAAWEIMTGAPVPAGADAVAMIEHVEISGKQIRLLPPRKLKAGENIVDQGAQAREGDELLPAGSAIHAAQIALAASCGYAALEVFRRLRVAILTTGDELVPVEFSPGPGQIRNSNAPMLAALVAASGGEPWILPTAHDNADALEAALAQAIQADMLLISGGVSAGKFDLVEPALARAGARFHFTGVRIQPGKPLVFGELPVTKKPHDQNEYRTKCLFGHPGNPVSTAVTFLLFAAPVLRALAGGLDYGPRFALAKLAAGTDAHGKPGLTRFLPASCTFSATTDNKTGGTLPEVALVPMQGSGDLVSLARANCFLVVPEDAKSLEAGTIVRILLY